MKLLKNKIKITHRAHSFLFAFLMSFVTSSVVSAIMIFMTKGLMVDFFQFWLLSILRAWPVVLILILIFVPIINKSLEYIFEKKND